MEISYSKHREKKEKHYINFRIRNIVKKFCIANAEKMKGMDEVQRAIFISEGTEELICMEFWVKQKQKNNLQSKAA